MLDFTLVHTTKALLVHGFYIEWWHLIISRSFLPIFMALPIAKILSVKNAQAWVSMVSYLEFLFNISILITLVNMKPLRPMPAHF